MQIQSTDEYLEFEESRDRAKYSAGLKFNRNKLSLQSSYMRRNKFLNPRRTTGPRENVSEKLSLEQKRLVRSRELELGVLIPCVLFPK